MISLPLSLPPLWGIYTHINGKQYFESLQNYANFQLNYYIIELIFYESYNQQTKTDIENKSTRKSREAEEDNVSEKEKKLNTKTLSSGIDLQRNRRQRMNKVTMLSPSEQVAGFPFFLAFTTTQNTKTIV